MKHFISQPLSEFFDVSLMQRALMGFFLYFLDDNGVHDTEVSETILCTFIINFVLFMGFV